jgi:hypothetical protein
MGIDHKTSLSDALQNHWSQPIELLPLLMIIILLVLAVESLLANKFYRQEPSKEEELTSRTPRTQGEEAT